MAAVWIQLHLVAQGFFERVDGFPLDHEIVNVVHDLHSRIAAQPGQDALQGASLDVLLPIDVAAA